MNDIKALLEIDFKTVFLGIFLILAGLKAGTMLIEWLLFDKLGIETKWMREKRQDHEMILANSNAIKELAEIHKRDNDISNKHDDELRDDLSQFMSEVRSDIGEIKSNFQESIDNTVKYREVSKAKEKRLDDRIDTLVDASKQRDISVEAISVGLEKLTKIFIDKEISDYRWEIINFATAISENKPCTKEAFRHCFATYEKYEKILEENGLENGEVTVSMEIVSEAYKKKMLEGF